MVCGGAENMSMAPLQVDGNDARWGVPLGGGLKMRDSLWDGLTDQFVGTPMGITAENLAVKYGISREVSQCYVFVLFLYFFHTFQLHAFISQLLSHRFENPCFAKDCDKLAIRSQQTWGEAKKNGVFDLEMANVEITTKKGTKVSQICQIYTYLALN